MAHDEDAARRDDSSAVSSDYASGRPQPAGSGTVDKMLTPANVVTLVRICLVPAFVVALIAPWPAWVGIEGLGAAQPWVAAAIFIVISCTDWLDGYLARSRGEVTDFGKFMDPLADKILVVAALLALVELGSLPSWPVIIIVAREFIVSGVRMVAASKGEVIAASWYGKFKTVFQMIAIVLFVLKESPAVALDLPPAGFVALYVISWLVMLVALALTIVSMVDYVRKARHLLGIRSKKERSAAKASASDEGAKGVADARDADTANAAVADAAGADALAVDGSVANAAAAAGGTPAAPPSGAGAAGEGPRADGALSDAGVEAGSGRAADALADAYSLASQVIEAAVSRGLHVGTAESCTGGLIAAALTEVPGSSAAVYGGIVSYANEVKQNRLGVGADTLDAHGAVSEPVAVQMSLGARKALGADVCVSVTGIAGPGGAVPGKPVGTVWIGVAGTDGAARARLFHFDGDRDEVREATVRAALLMMLEELRGSTEHSASAPRPRG